MWINAWKHNFETLMGRLTSTLVLNLLDGHDNFVVYKDASGIRLGYVLI